MSKKPRLHEVAKAIGTSAKVLMSELSGDGYEFKTHMAALDDDVMAVIQKKYPGIQKKLDDLQAEGSAKVAPKRKKKTTKKGKVISSRTQAKREAEKEKKEKEKASETEVQILKDDECATVEQKVIRGGIIRRRRVEEVEEPTVPAKEPEKVAAEKPVEKREEQKLDEPKSVETADRAPRKIEQTSSIKVVRRPEPKPVEKPAETPKSPTKEVAVKKSAPTLGKTKEIDVSQLPPSSRKEEQRGRDLSAPRRLKVVGTSTPPSAMKEDLRKPDLSKPKKIAKIDAVSESPAASSDDSDAKKDKKKVGAGSLKNWVAPKVTKKDLFGMTEEVEISRLGGRRPKKASQRSDRKTKITTPGEQKRKVRVGGEITVADLANQMGLKAVEVVRKLVGMGQMVSAHQSIDFDTATLVATDFGYETVSVEVTVQKMLEADEIKDDEASLVERPPVVTIMGHVDHGKTSLLDYIRKSKVVAKEAGGITQHIGAYQVEHNKKKITFLDTPGHQAFSKMRSRGAQVTDIVILVVGADEGPKPQTLEALAHARAAKVPIIVALNKIDKPDANPDKVMQEMSGHELVPEDWGGDTIYVKCSAHTGEGVGSLLDMILLQAEVLELKANPDRTAKGIVIESRLDKGKGPVATVVITAGTLKKGDPVVCGTAFGKVRGLLDDAGKQIKQAGPSFPVEILGFNIVPEAGQALQVVSEEGIARKASDLASMAKKEDEVRKKSRLSLEEMFNKMKSGEVSELRVVLKADVQGSVEAVRDSLEKIEHEEVKVNVIYSGVGGISDSDVSLAAASGAIVVGFNVRPAGNAKQTAAEENVQIKTYSIIYELIDDVKAAMAGLLSPEIKESTLGQAEVREVFTLSKQGTIAGCFIKSGKVVRKAHARLIRDSVVVYEDRIDGLRRFKDDAREVQEGFECGIRLENYTDIKVGDIIECYEKVELAKAVS